MNATVLQRLEKAEEAIGNNLVWLTDEFDFQIRRKDPEVLARLAQLNEGWAQICHAMKEVRANA